MNRFTNTMKRIMGDGSGVVVETYHQPLCENLGCGGCGTPPPDLESAVISAAINFRKAEIAAWQKSEVGTDEEVVEAKQEKSRAYLALVNATAALMDEREGHG